MAQIGFGLSASRLVTALRTLGAFVVKPESTEALSLDALLVVAPTLIEGAVITTVDRLLGMHPDPPILLISDLSPDNAGYLTSRRIPLYCTTGDPAHLVWATAIRATAEGPYSTLKAAMTGLTPAPVPWLLNRAIEAALETMFRGEPDKIRSVSTLAAVLGCSPEHLARLGKAHGVRLGRLLRWTTVIAGLATRQSSRRSWTSISAELGFPSLSAWSQFVRALTGNSPTSLERQSVRHWTSVLVRDCLDPRSEILKRGQHLSNDKRGQSQ